MPTDTIIDHRYQLGPRLGWGGMADVFEARDLRLERRVAVKSYRVPEHGSGLRRFIAEAELQAGLSHPGLLTVFDMGFDGRRPFLVLQLASGGTLRDRLDTGPVAPDRVAEIGAAIADVLSYVHGEGIVHRDVKPSNVLFDDDGECYLADFGIARALSAERVTDAKEFVGTAAYLAPEQVTDRDVGPPADVYALGLVLLECLTGEPEYLGNDMELMLARLSHRPKIPAGWGGEWRAVLTAMTEPNPAARPTADECVRLLRALRNGATLPIPVPPDRKRRVYGALACLAAAALVTFGFTAGPSQLTGRPVSDPAQVVRTPAPQQTQTPTQAPTQAQVPAVQQPPPPAEPVSKHSKHKPGKGKSGRG